MKKDGWLSIDNIFGSTTKLVSRFILRFINAMFNYLMQNGKHLESMAYHFNNNKKVKKHIV